MIIIINIYYDNDFTKKTAQYIRGQFLTNNISTIQFWSRSLRNVYLIILVTPSSAHTFLQFTLGGSTRATEKHWYMTTAFKNIDYFKLEVHFTFKRSETKFSFSPPHKDQISRTRLSICIQYDSCNFYLRVIVVNMHLYLWYSCVLAISFWNIFRL